LKQVKMSRSIYHKWEGHTDFW